MITNNKLDKSFGPIGTIAGITLLFVGLISIFFTFSGLFLILIGAFVGFTSTSSMIDFDKKKVRFSNNLFGFLQIGRWIKIESNMKIGINQSNRVWRAYSRGSQSIDLKNKDFRLLLFDENNKQILPLMKANTIDLAKKELESLASRLELSKI